MGILLSPLLCVYDVPLPPSYKDTWDCFRTTWITEDKSSIPRSLNSSHLQRLFLCHIRSRSPLQGWGSDVPWGPLLAYHIYFVFLSILKMSFYCLLAYIISNEKSAAIIIVFPIHSLFGVGFCVCVCLFCLATFMTFSLSLAFSYITCAFMWFPLYLSCLGFVELLQSVIWYFLPFGESYSVFLQLLFGLLCRWFPHYNTITMKVLLHGQWAKTTLKDTFDQIPCVLGLFHSCAWK